MQPQQHPRVRESLLVSALCRHGRQQLPTLASRSCVGLFSSHLMQNCMPWMAEYFLTHRRVVQLNLFRDLEDAPGPPRQQEMLGQWLLWKREKLYYWAAQRKQRWKGEEGRRALRSPRDQNASAVIRAEKLRLFHFQPLILSSSGEQIQICGHFLLLLRGKWHQF